MLRGLTIGCFCLLGTLVTSSRADLRAPVVWWDSNAIVTTPDWHYRVPIAIAAGTSVDSTLRVNVDFAALLSQLGIGGTFDANSPRVVRGNGTLVTNQEFTDTIYNSATDASGNARGEVRFILEDAAPTTYYLYFDIAANGAKPLNTQTPINGSFEFGASGSQDPPGWDGSRSGNGDAQVRPSESPSITTDGSTANPRTRTTDGTPFMGAQSYLIGARSNNENDSTAATLRRTFRMPSSCPTGLSLRYRPEGWDSSWSNATQFDYIRIRVTGTTSAVLVGPDAASSYATLPYSPNFSSNPWAGGADNNDSGYGRYNSFDLNDNGGHELGMSVTRGAEPWFNATTSLSGFAAGSTVTLEIVTSHETSYRSWFHIDNVEWCVVNAALGTPEAFGVNLTAPAAATIYTAGQRLTIRAQVDALPTGAGTPVTADVFDNGNTLVASGIRLYNNGTHGDATANDTLWSNDGSVAADPTYTFSGTSASGPNWRVRVQALDASTSAVGATNGLVHIPAQPTTPVAQANFYNVDEQLFEVRTPQLVNSKTVAVISDPVNNTTNPKSIPGAIQEYTVSITNQGTGPVDNDSMEIVDSIAPNTALCGLGGAVVTFQNGTPSSGLTFNAASNVSYSNSSPTDWGYSPSPDAGGCDANIRHIRISPRGTMAGSSAAGNPYFEVRFRVRVL